MSLMREAWAAALPARASRAKSGRLRENFMVESVPGLGASRSEGTQGLVKLAEPAELLGVGEGPRVDEFDAGLGDVAREHLVGGADVVGADDAVQDDVLLLAGESDVADA